nr:hypothetical protein CFP56_74706 [Quercus suber]
MQVGTPAANEKVHGETQDFSDLESSLLASSPPHAAVSTPRTPRQHSKSVDLPHARAATIDTPTTNRFSLPPEFSNIGETTVDSTTDMVTDVAVRFSLPGTTITVSKPYIVTIPPSSSSETPDSPQHGAQASRPDPRTIRRSSVTFADHIAPLNIKKIDPRDESQSIKESTTSRTKSIVRRPLLLEDVSDSGQPARDHISDTRVSANCAIVPSRFGSAQLPGLKEESVEDMSLSDRKRMAERDENSEFLLPARIAAVKAMQERRLHESAEKAKARRAARQHNRPLAEIRDLPSLNFSTMDLVDKLNFALQCEIRPTKSMDVARRHDIAEIFCPSPQRPQSTEPLIERYTSFFIKPEDLTGLEELGDGDQDGSIMTDAIVPVLQVQESTAVEEPQRSNHLSLDRPLSPEDFLHVATQVNRLSIPSVSGLSERLSELLPCLKNLHLGDLLSSDDDVAHTIDDIHQLGRGPRPGTTLSCRTSAGFRTLAERAEEIVLNGTHDSALPGAGRLSINKELPPLPASASADKVSTPNATDNKQSYLSGSVSAPSVFGNQDMRPASTLFHQKSPTTEEEMRQMLPPESNPIARGAKRSLMLSGISTRPWNQDENYPWAGSNITIDLSVPSAAHTRKSITSDVIRVGRRSRSLDFTSLHDISDTIRGIDIGSITTLNRSASLTTEQATGVTVHARKQSMRSIIGSISKKIGLGSRTTAIVNDATTRHVASPIKVSSDRESRVQSHRAGDRYPTSSLTPPSNLNLDEVRSFFSDDSSERHRNASLKKRLTNFKSKGKSVRLDANTSNRSIDAGETTYDAGSAVANRLGASSSTHTYNAGMGKAEFHMKRFGERLRLLLAKGGELFRSMSRRSRTPRIERVRDDWLSDSLYSGV